MYSSVPGSSYSKVVLVYSTISVHVIMYHRPGQVPGTVPVLCFIVTVYKINYPQLSLPFDMIPGRVLGYYTSTLVHVNNF